MNEIIQHSIGEKVSVRITSIAPFGAFCDLVDGGSGLIHISEIDNKFIKNIEDYLPVGSVCEVVITKCLDKPFTYALSLKRLSKRKRQPLKAKIKPLNRKDHNKEILEEWNFSKLKENLDYNIDREYNRLTGGK